MIFFITRLLISLKVKEFWKSVNICRSYGQLSAGLFFLWNTLYMWVTAYLYTIAWCFRNETGRHHLHNVWEFYYTVTSNNQILHRYPITRMHGRVTGFNPGWKIRDPGWKDPQKVQNGRYSAIDRPTGKQSRAPVMETPQTIFWLTEMNSFIHRKHREMTDSREKQHAARLTQREQFCLCSLYCHSLQQCFI